jgi:hypothetical protein
MVSLARTREFFRIKETEYSYKHRQNPRGKPVPDTGRLIHLSAGHSPNTQSQTYTGVEDNVECS